MNRRESGKADATAAGSDDPVDDPVEPGWSRCPGCGLSLPDAGDPLTGRRNASAACWHLYGEVAGFELAHIDALGRFHQLLVDTYGAQHAGGGAPSIGVAFSLIGLQLALEEGWDGLAVRDAHRDLARRFGAWPAFEPPAHSAALTVFDVALVDRPEAYEPELRAWASDVWTSWAAEQERVRRLIAERLIGERPAPSTRPTTPAAGRAARAR